MRLTLFLAVVGFGTGWALAENIVHSTQSDLTLQRQGLLGGIIREPGGAMVAVNNHPDVLSVIDVSQRFPYQVRMYRSPHKESASNILFFRTNEKERDSEPKMEIVDCIEVDAKGWLTFASKEKIEALREQEAWGRMRAKEGATSSELATESKEKIKTD